MHRMPWSEASPILSQVFPLGKLDSTGMNPISRREIGFIKGSEAETPELASEWPHCEDPAGATPGADRETSDQHFSANTARGAAEPLQNIAVMAKQGAAAEHGAVIGSQQLRDVLRILPQSGAYRTGNAL